MPRPSSLSDSRDAKLELKIVGLGVKTPTKSFGIAIKQRGRLRDRFCGAR